MKAMDLSKHAEKVSSDYKLLSKTQIRLLSSQVPESFLEKFKDEETALKELLDTIYGTLDYNHDPQ